MLNKKRELKTCSYDCGFSFRVQFFAMKEKKLKNLFGFPSKFRSSKLPTNADVLKAVYFELENHNSSLKNAIKAVVDQIDELWKTTDIPIKCKKTIERRVNSYFEKFLKVSKSDKNHAASQVKQKSFKVSK